MVKETTLKKRLLAATIVPIALLGAALLIVSYIHIKNIMTDQMGVGLEDVAISTVKHLEYAYPGDYSCIGDESLVLMKGEYTLNDRFEYIDSVKERTDLEISVFYDNIRFLTTIKDENGERILGTFCNDIIKRDVYGEGQSKFYDNVSINGGGYFAWYEPLVNSDGTVVGMVAVGESAERARNETLAAILPLMGIGLIIIVIMGVVVARFGGTLAGDIMKLGRFMDEVAKGNLKTDIEPSVARRGDEVSRMGQSAMKMQSELRKLVEQDPLTLLANRRSAARQMSALMRDMDESAVPFAVVMCDIDHFKSVNDTYGHDAGDEVLRRVSSILKGALKGKGFVARWGGEEFLLGFSGYTVQDARFTMISTLDRIRASVISVDGADIRITMSFGVTDGRPGLSDEAIIKNADELLYYAKTHGRNRVVTAEDVAADEAEAEAARAADANISDWLAAMPVEEGMGDAIPAMPQEEGAGDFMPAMPMESEGRED